MSKIPRLRTMESSSRAYPASAPVQLTQGDSEPCTPQADSKIMDLLMDSTFKLSLDAAGRRDDSWLIAAHDGPQSDALDETELDFEDAEDKGSMISYELLSQAPDSPQHPTSQAPPNSTTITSPHTEPCVSASQAPVKSTTSSFVHWLVGLLGLGPKLVHTDPTATPATPQLSTTQPNSHPSTGRSRSSRSLSEAFDRVAHLEGTALPAATTADRQHPSLPSPPCGSLWHSTPYGHSDGSATCADEYASACSTSYCSSTHSLEDFGALPTGRDGRRGAGSQPVPKGSPGASSGGGSSGMSVTVHASLASSVVVGCDVAQWLMDATVDEELDGLEDSMTSRR